MNICYWNVFCLLRISTFGLLMCVTDVDFRHIWLLFLIEFHIQYCAIFYGCHFQKNLIYYGCRHLVCTRDIRMLTFVVVCGLQMSICLFTKKEPHRTTMVEPHHISWWCSSTTSLGSTTPMPLHWMPSSTSQSTSSSMLGSMCRSSC